MKKIIKNKNLHSLSFISFLFFVGLTSCFFCTTSIFAEQSINIDASTLIPQSTLFLSPNINTVSEGSIVETSVYINTEGKSINTLQLNINFDQTKLELVRLLSGGNSIIDIFVDKPTFSNIDGTVSLSGVIPSGIITSKGLVVTMVFKAINIGKATVSISETSRVLANDGQGTEVSTKLFNGTYNITQKPPKGPNVFSKTHPVETLWYGNNGPDIYWNKDSGVTSFSYILDDKPLTIPRDNMRASATSTYYKNLADGVWYFHVKAKKQGVWGPTTHFAFRIDMTTPEAFKPVVDLLTSSDSNSAVVSFSANDQSSGIDHYEVSVVEKNKFYKKIIPFIIAKSPYRFSLQSNSFSVIVRAYDKAGNYTEESVDINPSYGIIDFLQNNYLVTTIVLVLIAGFFLGYKIGPGMKSFFKVVQIKN